MPTDYTQQIVDSFVKFLDQGHNDEAHAMLDHLSQQTVTSTQRLQINRVLQKRLLLLDLYDEDAERHALLKELSRLGLINLITTFSDSWTQDECEASVIVDSLIAEGLFPTTELVLRSALKNGGTDISFNIPVPPTVYRDLDTNWLTSVGHICVYGGDASRVIDLHDEGKYYFAQVALKPWLIHARHFEGDIAYCASEYNVHDDYNVTLQVNAVPIAQRVFDMSALG